MQYRALPLLCGLPTLLQYFAVVFSEPQVSSNLPKGEEETKGLQNSQT